MRLFTLFLISLLQSGIVSSQRISPSELQALNTENFQGNIANLRQFLRLANDGNFEDQIETNLRWCDSVFTHLNFKTTLLKTDGAPLLFAEKIYNKNRKSILFYLQIDGQPVDTSQWSQPDPFEPVLKEFNNGKWSIIPIESIGEKIDLDWRIFGRSTSDSKGPAMSLISALQILESKKVEPEFNVKVIMDFQEELGSPNLPKAVLENKNLLDAEMLFIMDGTRHLSNLPTLTYGARGIATANIKVFGPKNPLHSGQYGNYAPNPNFEAARLIASMKDENGKVTISGFYDGVQLTELDRKILGQIPEQKDSLLLRLGISEPDQIGQNYQEALQYPSLNIRGLSSGWTGKEVRTIIPEDVTIEIDMRLVPETPAERQIALLRKHIEQHGFKIVENTPTDTDRANHKKLAAFNYRIGSKPFRTEMDTEIGFYLNKALNKVFGTAIVNMRTTGGSQPMAPFIQSLNVPAVSIRIPNPDNSIHAPDENIRLGNYKEGILTCLAILTEPLN